MKRRNPKLRSEDPKNGLKAISAFWKMHPGTYRKRNEYDYVFEHGHLWITHQPTGAIWSVEDAEGPGTVGGFDFEQVSYGEEENPFNLDSLSKLVGVKPLTVKLQKVAGQIQLRIEKPTKELLRKLGIGRSSNPSSHKLVIRSLHDCMLACSEGDWSLVSPGPCTREEAQEKFAGHLRNLRTIAKMHKAKGR